MVVIQTLTSIASLGAAVHYQELNRKNSAQISQMAKECLEANEQTKQFLTLALEESKKKKS